jgi:hypothetical protein
VRIVQDYNFAPSRNKTVPLVTRKENPTMKPAFVTSWRAVAITVVLLAAGCSHHRDLTRPAVQDNFGVQMAKMNLWREAMFRFQRAVQINPGDAMAHNNLAVAYEANGDFEKARREYLEALKLDRTNQYIQKNYSRYVEFLSRNKKRQTGQKAASTTTPPATTPTHTVTGGGGTSGAPPIGSAYPPPGTPSAPQPPGGTPSDLPQPQPSSPQPKPPTGGSR